MNAAGSSAGSYLQTTTGGGDTFTASPFSSKISGSGYDVTAADFKFLAAYCLGPNCTATLTASSNMRPYSSASISLKARL